MYIYIYMVTKNVGNYFYDYLNLEILQNETLKLLLVMDISGLNIIILHDFNETLISQYIIK